MGHNKLLTAVSTSQYLPWRNVMEANQNSIKKCIFSNIRKQAIGHSSQSLSIGEALCSYRTKIFLKADLHKVAGRNDTAPTNF